MKKITLFLLGLALAGCGTARSAATPAPQQIAPTRPVAVETKETEATPTQAAPATDESEALAETNLDHAELLGQVLFGRSGAEEALAQIRQSGDTRFVAGLIDSLRYRRDRREEIGFTLNTLTGEKLDDDWFAWHEWAGNHPEIESFEGYVGWKANLFAQIDPNFLRFVYPNIRVDPNSRVEEIVWGGVRVDGIPALDNPKMVDPQEAGYLIANERVFGVSLNGDTRAYPARFLDWHEMFNDVVGGQPVSLAY